MANNNDRHDADRTDAMPERNGKDPPKRSGFSFSAAFGKDGFDFSAKLDRQWVRVAGRILKWLLWLSLLAVGGPELIENLKRTLGP